jgi:DNA-binding NarL/FixJ family response regulator
MNNNKPFILIVEDEWVVAQDIEYMLKKNDYKNVNRCTSYNQALQIISEKIPDLLICDIHLDNNKNGIDLVGEIDPDHDMSIIYLTAYSDDETLNAASKTHPLSYITKPFTENQLITAIKMAINSTTNKNPKPTTREKEILRYIAKGKRSKYIAEQLKISPNTVDTHRKNMIKKYKVKSTAELVFLSTQWGWFK